MFKEYSLKEYVMKNLTFGEVIRARSRLVKKELITSIDTRTDLTPIAFYPHFVLFKTKNGFTETYTYWNVWQEFLGGNTCDFEGEVIREV